MPNHFTLHKLGAGEVCFLLFIYIFYHCGIISSVHTLTVKQLMELWAILN